MNHLTLSEGQRLAIDQLRALAAASTGTIDLPVEPAPAIEMPGWLRAELSLDCADTPHVPGGLDLRRRERFTLLIPADFPFAMPAVRVRHRRWARCPHVQWGRHLCLYAAPAIEWVPADGMYGFVGRLTLWLEKASLKELDPEDQPLHPPVAYTDAGSGVVVIRADIGGLAPPPTQSRRGESAEIGGREPAAPPYRLVVGIGEIHHEHRFDVVDWVSPQVWLRRCIDGELTPSQGRRLLGTVAVLADREMGFEYPNDARALVEALEGLGVPRDELFAAIGQVGAVNRALAIDTAVDGLITPVDLHLFVGTPSRRLADGVLRQHLVCWKLDDLGRKLAEYLPFANADHAPLAELGGLANELLPTWIEVADTTWVQIMEARNEVTVRRDINSSAQWVQGRRVMVLGCGALGAPIAEFSVRAGAREVHVVDNGIVTPGILVRQPYSDADIGSFKAIALAAKLNRIADVDTVRPSADSAERVLLRAGAIPPDVDLVIDATANATVASLLELRRSQARSDWPPVISVMVNQDARRGVVTVAKRGATGAGRDILRRLALAGRGQHAATLADAAADFFPTESRTPPFQPEPGCSAPTFTGSAADLGALAGHLFGTGLRALTGDSKGETAEPMVAAVVRLDHDHARPGPPALGWPNDEVCQDPDSGYEIRISQPALSHMRAEVRRGARVRQPDVETGGLMLGQVDDACRCIWIDDASGPPPDSLLSAVHFDHGIIGVEELVAYHRKRSGKLSTFVGMWHSHPFGAASPSPTDEVAMQQLVTPVAKGPRRALVLILGGDEDRWDGWVNGDRPPALFGRFITGTGDGEPADAPPVPGSHRVEGWPGGWLSRPSPRTTGRTLRRRPLRKRRLSAFRGRRR